MARCPHCKKHFRTLEDEEGMHDCPYCGYGDREDDHEKEPDFEEMATDHGGYPGNHPAIIHDLLAVQNNDLLAIISGQPRLHLEVSLWDEAEWDHLIAAVESGEVGADTQIER